MVNQDTLRACAVFFFNLNLICPGVNKCLEEIKLPVLLPMRAKNILIDYLVKEARSAALSMFSIEDKDEIE